MAQVVIQVIENQALVWLGAMYAPLLPVFGLVANIIAFYFKLVLAVWLHSPPTTRYSASRTSNLAYGLMLRKPLYFQQHCCCQATPSGLQIVLCIRKCFSERLLC